MLLSIFNPHRKYHLRQVEEVVLFAHLNVPGARLGYKPDVTTIKATGGKRFSMVQERQKKKRDACFMCSKEGNYKGVCTK